MVSLAPGCCGGVVAILHLPEEPTIVGRGHVSNWTLAKIGQHEREITCKPGVSGTTKLTGPIEGIAQEGSIVRRRLPPVAGAAQRSRCDPPVAEPSAPGAILCIPIADDVRRGLKATDPWEPLQGPQSGSLGMPTILPHPSNSPESSTYLFPHVTQPVDSSDAVAALGVVQRLFGALPCTAWS